MIKYRPAFLVLSALIAGTAAIAAKVGNKVEGSPEPEIVVSADTMSVSPILLAGAQTPAPTGEYPPEDFDPTASQPAHPAPVVQTPPASVPVVRPVQSAPLAAPKSGEYPPLPNAGRAAAPAQTTPPVAEPAATFPQPEMPEASTLQTAPVPGQGQPQAVSPRPVPPVQRAQPQWQQHQWPQQQWQQQRPQQQWRQSPGQQAQGQQAYPPNTPGWGAQQRPGYQAQNRAYPRGYGAPRPQQNPWPNWGRPSGWSMPFAPFAPPAPQWRQNYPTYQPYPVQPMQPAQQGGAQN